jgi:hypothetical protein
MTAADLLNQLRARGVAVWADGDRLRLRPKSALTDHDLVTVAACKPGLLQLLAADGAPRTQHQPDRVLPFRRPAPAAPPPVRLAPSAPCGACGSRVFALVADDRVTCLTCDAPAMAEPVSGRIGRPQTPADVFRTPPGAAAEAQP